jgi:hypothetical protein
MGVELTAHYMKKGLTGEALTQAVEKAPATQSKPLAITDSGKSLDDRAALGLMESLTTDDLTQKVAGVMRPAIAEFNKAHQYIAVKWELKVTIDDGEKSFSGGIGTDTKAYNKMVKLSRGLRKKLAA